MAYLSKSERKQQIIDSAKKVVLAEGLNTLTVRKLAQSSDLSVGQVHHHFNSVHDLKAEVFLELVHENLNLSHFSESSNGLEKLIYLLGSEANTSETPYIRVWNDAESNIQSSLIFKQAYARAIKIWQNSIIAVLKEGLAEKIFIFDLDKIQDISWRFISLAIGLECVSNLQLEGVNSDFFHKQILFMIRQELQM